MYCIFVYMEHNKTSQYKTGDLILFHGFTFDSKLIQLGTFSRISHIALYIKLDGEEYLLESMGMQLNLPDYYSGTVKDGVQLTRFRDKIYGNKTYGKKPYYGTVYARQLQIQESSSSTIDHTILLVRLLQFYKEQHKKPFERNQLEMFKSVARLPQSKNTAAYFCSELIAEALQHVGILQLRKTSNSYLPGDFIIKSFAKDLCPPFKYGAITQIETKYSHS